MKKEEGNSGVLSAEITWNLLLICLAVRANIHFILK